MSKRSEAVKLWRKNCKQRIIDSMGSKCQICGYNKCNDALELHHIDPTKKEFGFGAIRANPTSWPSIVKELKKCVLLCSICHRELHCKLIVLPEILTKFKEEFTDYKVSKELEITYCPICGNEKNFLSKTCSLACGGKLNRKVDWDSIDLYDLKITQKMTYEKIGEILNISGNSVKKRAVKLKIV